MRHQLLYADAASRPERPSTRPPLRGVAPAELSWLRTRFKGEIVLPADAAYATAREGFNPRYDPHPAAVLSPHDAADLRIALALVQRTGLPVAVRGGGHSLTGRSNTDGIVIDMVHFQSIAIDGTTATVGAGCRQGPLRQALQEKHLHLPMGDSGQVAIGGFMQGGGYGHTARCFGMNSDHVTAVTVMLADGRIVHADARRNADLFWATRGGAGGGFGVLLEITYRFHAAPRLAYDSLVWRAQTDAERASAAAVIAMVERDFTGTGAPGTSVEMLLTFGAPGHEGPWLFLNAAHLGNARGLTHALAPLVAAAPPFAGYDEAWNGHHDATHALSRQARYLNRSPGLDGWRALVEVVATGAAHRATLYLHPHGDAIDAVPREASAFIHRTASCLVAQDVFWPAAEAGDDALALQRRWAGLVRPYSAGRVYQNFPNDELADYREAYWGEAFPALLAVRRKYDPVFFFAGKQDVSPHPDRGEPPALWPPHVADALARPIMA